jgi:hypothetical protein
MLPFLALGYMLLESTETWPIRYVLAEVGSYTPVHE